MEWLGAWVGIRASDAEGLVKLKILLSKTKHGLNGPGEMIHGSQTGDGKTTLMHQAATYGRNQCVDFMLEHGAVASLRSKTSTGMDASKYAKFNEKDVYDPNVSFHSINYVFL